MKIGRLEAYSTSDDGYYWYDHPTKSDIIEKINEIVDFLNNMNDSAEVEE